MRKLAEKDIRIRYIDILDFDGLKWFNKAMKIFLSIFKEDVNYVKIMRKILRRKIHPKNTIFRIMVE